VASYNLVNFALRPAKYVERRMIVDTLRRLQGVVAPHTYRYVGFGSVYFTDFLLMHRELGIHSMVSIEVEEGDEDRFKFNVPLKCVDLKFGHSNDVLPELDWSERSIVWLDYDRSLETAFLADVETVASQIVPGSVLILTFNANPGGLEGRRESLVKRVGPEIVPLATTDATLGDWGMAAVYREIVNDRIAATLMDRNGGLPANAQLRYDQLFYFQYQDGQRMLTVGGILYDVGQANHVAACGFDDSQGVRRGDEPFRLVVPRLTQKEVRHLNEQLPLAAGASLEAAGLEEEELDGYAQIYRYVPAYVYAESS
jgi:hypothetical protein